MVYSNEKIQSNSIALIGCLLLILFYIVYRLGKSKGGVIPLPNGGSGLPPNWSALTTVKELTDTFHAPGFDFTGFGTNEDAFFSIMDSLTNDQIAAVYNQYKQTEGDDLLDVIRDEFSGDELTRALHYFAFLN